MAHDNAFLICENKCKVPGYSKEQVDELLRRGSLALIDRNSGEEYKLWVGTKAEYDALSGKDAHTIYIKTDDETVPEATHAASATNAENDENGLNIAENYLNKNFIDVEIIPLYTQPILYEDGSAQRIDLSELLPEGKTVDDIIDIKIYLMFKVGNNDSSCICTGSPFYNIGNMQINITSVSNKTFPSTKNYLFYMTLLINHVDNELTCYNLLIKDFDTGESVSTSDVQIKVGHLLMSFK